MMNDMAKDSDMKGASDKRLVPELRFPEFEKEGEWDFTNGNNLFVSIVNKNHNSDLPILAITQDKGAVPREMIDYRVIVSNNSIKSYKIVEVGDFIISLRSFQGGIEYSNYKGLCSPAYIVLRKISDTVYNDFYRHYLKSANYILELNRNIEGIRDGKMISYLQFSNIKLPFPSPEEQQKIAECLSSIDEEISAMKEKVEQLKVHKKGLLQKLFPVAGKFVPELRFPEFKKDWNVDSMQDIFDMKNGYTPSKSNLTYWDNGTIPWFRMEDIRKNGHILSDSIQHVTQQAVKNSGLFPAYSIIVATTATIGEHALIIVDSLANQRFTFLTKRKSFKDKINMMYFHHYMFIIDEWCKKNTNSGGLVSVNMPAFKQLLIPFPCPAEQKKIAECLSSIDELISLYENKVTLLEQHKKGLMQQLFPKL